MSDTLILMVLALVVFGPRRLPQIGRQIGKLMYEFRKASNDFKFQMEEELRNAEEAERRKKEEERLKTLALEAPAAEPAAAQPVSATETAVATETTPVADATGRSSIDAWEQVYPDVLPMPDVAVTGVSAESAAAAPQIQPPSTGETVAADAPNTAVAVAEQAVTEPAAAPEVPAVITTEIPATPPAPAAENIPAPLETSPQSTPATEQVTHNG